MPLTGFHPTVRTLFDIVLLTCLSLGALGVTASMAFAPRDLDKGVAVMFAPWTSQRTALVRSVRAGARFVRFGGVGFIAVVVPDDANYLGRVRSEGAWLLLDPEIVAACLAPLQAQQTP